MTEPMMEILALAFLAALAGVAWRLKRGPAWYPVATIVVSLLLILANLARAEPPDAGFIDPAVARAMPLPVTGDPVLDVLAAVERAGDANTAWSVKLGLVLIALVGLLRKYAAKLPGVTGAFFASSEGGSTLLFLLTFLGTFGAALSAGRPLSATLAWSALLLAMTTAGGWHVCAKPLWQRVVRPLLARALPGLFPAADGGAASVSLGPAGQRFPARVELKP